MITVAALSAEQISKHARELGEAVQETLERARLKTAAAQSSFALGAISGLKEQ
jgi:hypothetical protein